MDSQDRVCPECGQAVERVVRRHKTLGAWVPVWGPGPCRNPDCATNGAAERASPQSPPRSPPPESAGKKP
ncbi:hypothetical protein ABT075_27740 [Streptomyces sp. NPDC002677]|uniref:hypothetical protein n=1 Tax=Streptomyces sp. NPDC002677 TaxID=3154774 RepID=UPI003323A588